MPRRFQKPFNTPGAAGRLTAEAAQAGGAAQASPPGLDAGKSGEDPGNRARFSRLRAPSGSPQASSLSSNDKTKINNSYVLAV